MVSKDVINDDLYKESLELIETPILILSNNAEILFSNSACRVLQDYELIKGKLKEILSSHKNKESFEYELRINSATYFLNFKSLEKKTWYLLKIEESRNEKEQLFVAEESFNRMFEPPSIGICQITPEGQIIKINESFAKLFGYRSSQEMMSKVNNIPRQLFADSGDTEKFFEQLEKEAESKAVLEIRFRKKGGPIFIGHLHIRKVEDLQNKNIFYEGCVEDITDRKSIELALQYSRNKYKHLVETLPYGIAEIDLKGYINYCNTPLEKMLGYFSGELIGKHITEISLGKFSQKQDIEFLFSVNNSFAKPIRMFDKIATKEGVILDVQINWDYQYDANKKVVGFISVISDVTEQKAAANALKESETRFRGIYEDSTIGIYRTTKKGEFLLANPSMCKLFGYDTFEEFQEKNAREIYFAPEERTSFINEINKVGFVKGYENRGVKKDGTLLFLRESAHAVKDEKGEIIFYDGIVEDYTEKKLMERNLIKAKEEAEEADQLKSAFLANMSHEVRTPMNGIVGFSNLLSNPGISDELRVKYTKIIRSRGEDLLRIINDILDVSKLEVNQLKLYQKEFKLNELMEQLYEIYKQRLKTFEKKGVEIKLKIDSKDKNYVLWGDETRVKQILTNFIDNAYKFTEKGYIEIGCELKGNSEIYFSVKDTGIGIPEKMQEVIFERFRQNDESPTRIYGGNGLGLSICKGLAKLMNGSVGVISKEKEGSTFYFNFPAKFIENKNYSNDSKHASYYWPDKKILLVEDDEISSALIEEYFEQTKAFIKVAGDGYSALRIIKDDDSFDLVLLDIGLPDISGLEVAKQIKQIKPALPVIAQTAFAMKEDEIKCKKAGCDGYLQKPIIKEIMLNRVGAFFTNK